MPNNFQDKVNEIASNSTTSSASDYKNRMEGIIADAKNKAVQEKQTARADEIEAMRKDLMQQIDHIKKGKEDWAGSMNNIVAVATLVFMDRVEQWWNDSKAAKQAEGNLKKEMDSSSHYSIDMSREGDILDAFIFDKTKPTDAQAQKEVREKFVQTLHDWAKAAPRNWEPKMEPSGKIYFEQTDPATHKKSKVDRDTFNAAKNDPNSGFHAALKEQLPNIKLLDTSKYNNNPQQQSSGPAPRPPGH